MRGNPPTYRWEQHEKLRIRVRLCGRCLQNPEGHTAGWCDECFNAWQREYRSRPENKERTLAHNRAYKKGKGRARATERERLRKAKIKGARLDRDVIYENGMGRCGICLEEVGRDEFEVDHVRPLAKGGMHDYSNVQPAHPRCNRRKWAND